MLLKGQESTRSCRGRVQRALGGQLLPVRIWVCTGPQPVLPISDLLPPTSGESRGGARWYEYTGNRSNHRDVLLK